MRNKDFKIYFKNFLLAFLTSFGFFITFLGVFKEFGLISNKVVFCGALIASLLFSAVVEVYFISRIKARNTTKFENWLSNNAARILLYYVIAIIFFVSIKAEAIWSQDDLKTLISLEWTIFGISIAIFLVWNVIILKYLKEKKPQKPTTVSSLSTLMYISNKSTFYGNATILFTTVSMLTCNLLLLTVATTFVYIGSSTLIVPKQIVVTLVLYFSTNTILELFMDIIKPLNEEKKALLQETMVTNEDVETQNRIIEKSNKTFIAIDEIAQLPHLSEEEKQRITRELLRDFLEADGTDTTEIDNKEGG